MTGWTEGVRREVLPNGLTLLAQAIPGAPAVSVVSAVRAGFFDEPDRLAGVSHVLEHMLFKGTPTRPVGAIPREVRAAGGSINAGTGYDHTSYITVLPPGALRLGLEVQSDALQHSGIDPDELRRELIVILEEARRKLDTPAAVAGETLHTLLFDHHRIRRWRIGTEAQLRRITREDVVEFYRGHYLPGETVVVMTGDLDPRAACEAAAACFGGWPAGTGQRDPSPAEPEWREVRARTIRGDVKRGDLALGWRTVGRFHPDAIPLDVASAVLTGGRSGWLYRELRAPGLMTAVGAGHFTPREVGVFSIGGEFDPARLGDSLAAIAGCVGRLRSEGPAAGDLHRVRTLLMAGWARRMQTAEGRAGALAAAELDGDYRLVDRDYSDLLAVSADRVRQAAAAWLDPGRVAGVVYLPEDSGEELTPGRLGELMSRPGPRAIARSAAGDGPETLPRSEPGPAGIPGGTGSARPASQPENGGPVHLALPGADLLVFRREGVPLVSLGLYQRRHREETAADAGIGALAVRAAVRGAGDWDAAELALRFEGMGGVLGPVVASEWTGFGASVLSRHAGAAAALLETVFREPRFDPDEVGREQQTLLDGLIQAADDMARHPVDLAFQARFGSAGYGLPVSGLPESVVRLTRARVVEWQRATVAAPDRRPLLVAVGDLRVAEFAESVARVFERYPSRREDRAPVSGAPPRPKTSRIAEERSKRQTAIAMLFPGPTRASPERFAAEVWSAIAGGLGGRLFLALRDRRSLAYVVRASIWRRAGAGALLTYLATSPEREAEAREQMLAELARFRDAPPDSDELTRAIRYLSGQLLIGRQTLGAVAGELAEAWLSRGPAGLEEFADPTAGIRAVTAGALHQLAERCFDPAAAVEGVVRGASRPAMFPGQV